MKICLVFKKIWMQLISKILIKIIQLPEEALSLFTPQVSCKNIDIQTTINILKKLKTCL